MMSMKLRVIMIHIKVHWWITFGTRTFLLGFMRHWWRIKSVEPPIASEAAEYDNLDEVPLSLDSQHNNLINDEAAAAAVGNKDTGNDEDSHLAVLDDADFSELSDGGVTMDRSEGFVEANKIWPPEYKANYYSVQRNNG